MLVLRQFPLAKGKAREEQLAGLSQPSNCLAPKVPHHHNDSMGELGEPMAAHQPDGFDPKRRQQKVSDWSTQQPATRQLSPFRTIACPWKPTTPKGHPNAPSTPPLTRLHPNPNIRSKLG